MKYDLDMLTYRRTSYERILDQNKLGKKTLKECISAIGKKLPFSFLICVLLIHQDFGTSWFLFWSADPPAELADSSFAATDIESLDSLSSSPENCSTKIQQYYI